MNIRIVGLFICLFLLTDCNRKTYYESPTGKSNEQVSYKIEPFYFDFPSKDSVAFKDYNIFISPADSTNFLAIINYNTYHLELYNLSNGKRHFKKALRDILGKDYGGFGGVNSFYFLNFDTILLAQENAITLFDTLAINKIVQINNSSVERNPEMFYENMGQSPIIYDSNQNSVAIQSYCSGCDASSKKFYEQPIEAIILLDSNKVVPSPIYYSEKYLDNYYGFAIHVYQTTIDDVSYFSFPVDPNIYIYNRKTKKMKVKGGRSQFQLKDAPPVKNKYKNDSEFKFNHLTQIPSYNVIIPDSYRSLYYRFFYKGIALENEDGTFNSYGDKELVLMVFDKNFDLIKEIDIGKHKYTTGKSFVTKEGLFLSQSHYKNTAKDKKTRFDIIKIDIK